MISVHNIYVCVCMYSIQRWGVVKIAYNTKCSLWRRWYFFLQPENKKKQHWTVYNKVHLLRLGGGGFMWTRAARMASSKTIWTLVMFFAEHSKYFSAPIFRLSLRPSTYLSGDCPSPSSFCTSSLSSLKSNLVPTRIIGMPAQWCLTSGDHWEDQEKRTEWIKCMHRVKRKGGENYDVG